VYEKKGTWCVLLFLRAEKTHIYMRQHSVVLKIETLKTVHIYGRKLDVFREFLLSAKEKETKRRA